MAEVIQFAPRRKVSLEEIRRGAIDDIQANWARFASDNHLNDYFIQSVPWASEQYDYLSDLNALSALEQKLNLSLQITAPSYDGERLGWTASFGLSKLGLIETPPLVFETYARCFAILLFLKLRLEEQRL